MCRDIAIFTINGILDDIFEGIDIQRIREKCEEFKMKCFYEELGINEDEIRKDRLVEYIKFFNISYICEYDIFDKKETFYKALEDNLPKETWVEIRNFLSEGNILSDFRVA